MHLTKEERYIRRRLQQARKQAREFYYCRRFPLNPKYIALELLRRRQDLDLVWLVDDMEKEFPSGIHKKAPVKTRAEYMMTMTRQDLIHGE